MQTEVRQTHVISGIDGLECAAPVVYLRHCGCKTGPGAGELGFVKATAAVQLFLVHFLNNPLIISSHDTSFTAAALNIEHAISASYSSQYHIAIFTSMLVQGFNGLKIFF